MPNWCSNSVTIRHENTAKLKELVTAMNEGKFCSHVIPLPKELENAVADSSINEENIRKFGYSNWYDYCVNEWGTKWEVDCYNSAELNDNEITANFDSAWSPPIGVYEELTKQGYYVEAYYYEPGCAFVGKYQDGFDECFGLDGCNSENVRDVIGEELDDYFAISENMAEWEEENVE